MNKPIDITKVVLTTERLTLRSWQPDDLNDFYNYAKVDGVGQMAGWNPHKNIEESQTILNHFIEGKHTFALVYQSKAIGSLGIEEYNEETFSEFALLQAREIGYVLAKDYWGQALMVEAVKAVIDYLFNEVDLDAIFVGHFVRNHQSQRVIEKAGFQFLKNSTYQTHYDTLETTREYVMYNPKHAYEDFKRID
ncbi:MAG: GNAT family N-acetyltransferase [Erysipelotrichaceae bacterium]